MFCLENKFYVLGYTNFSKWLSVVHDSWYYVKIKSCDKNII